MRRISIDYGTIWVCQCCALEHANGSCCPDGEHGGDHRVPWSAVDSTRFHAWSGLPYEEHAEDCVVRVTGERPADHECYCEFESFSRRQCRGCGSWLAGERHAFTLTRERQRFVRPQLPA
jgi:hypothetical protein